MQVPDIVNMEQYQVPSTDVTSGAIRPSVAVLLATFNGAKYLAEQLETILGQVGVIPTIYIRDDRSSDETAAILDSFATAYPRQVIRLADAPRRFGAACENFFSMLIELAGENHEFFSFSDQDDIWLPNKLERAIGQMKARNASGYASDLTAFSAAAQTEWVIRKSYPQRSYDYIFQSASAGCTYVLDAVAARLIASRIGSVDDHDWDGMSHDWLCYAVCRSHGLSWFIDRWSGIRYRQHDQNLFGAMPGIAGAGKRLALIRQGWYRKVLLRNQDFLNSNNQMERLIYHRIARFDCSDRLWLARNVRQLRREPKAQLGLAGTLIAGLI